MSCYSGPAGTEGVGECVAGKKTCEPDGSGYGACLGEVTPQPENCSTMNDEDCDGNAVLCTGSHLYSKRINNGLVFNLDAGG